MPKNIEKNWNNRYCKDTVTVTNWNNRYAVTKKSLRHISSKLPEGWKIHSYGQPAENHWEPWKSQYLSDEKRNNVEHMPANSKPYGWRGPSMSVPDIVRLHNPSTGNTASVYDHSQLFKTNRAAHEIWGRRFWNFRDHGDEISSMLKRLDSLPITRRSLSTNGQERVGVHLNLTRRMEFHSHGYYSSQGSALGWVSPDVKKDTVFLPSPAQMKSGSHTSEAEDNCKKWYKERSVHFPSGLPYSITYPESFGRKAEIFATLDHELGHIHSHQNTRRFQFNLLMRGNHQSSINPQNLEQTKDPIIHPDDIKRATEVHSTIKKFIKKNKKIHELPHWKNETPEVDHISNAISIYGTDTIDENYAEHFASWVHPTRPIARTTYEIGKSLGFPRTKKIDDIDSKLEIARSYPEVFNDDKPKFDRPWKDKE